MSGAQPSLSATDDTTVADAELQQRVLREHIASIYFIYDATFTARVGFIGVLGTLMYVQLRQPIVLGFVAMHLLVYLYLFRLPRWTRAAPASESPVWVRRITRVAVVLGVADAVAPWIFVSADSLPLTCVLMVVMMGNCARAVQSLRPVKPALYGHTLTMMGGLISALIVQDTSWHLFLATFAAIYLVMILRVGAKEHDQLTDTLIMRFENEALAERLHRQIEATERASAEKTRFLATASHDLRQPLHAIALFGAALENALRDRPESGNAERLMHAVNALGHSLDTMLDVSRLDAGVVTVHPQSVQLDAVFLALNHVFAPQAEERQLQLRVRASGLWVRSDPQLLLRMLSNLVDNALKYTERGGVIVVARVRGEAVRIDVRDTGIGIAPEQRERIFEEFYQIGNQARDRARGLGIGLSIVQRLSRLLAHPVSVDSRMGRGTRFRVELPAAEPPSAGAAEAAAQSGDAAAYASAVPPVLPSRVLLIDDEADIRAAMTELLRSWSVDIVAVANEAEAIAALEAGRRSSTPFDLLMCDYRLPDGDSGLEVGLRLHRRFEIVLPLLLVTGETAPERLQQVRESGVHVLFKPVGATVLRAALEELR